MAPRNLLSCRVIGIGRGECLHDRDAVRSRPERREIEHAHGRRPGGARVLLPGHANDERGWIRRCQDRKSTRLNSSHGYISYAVFCLKKKKHYYEHTYCCNKTRAIQLTTHTTSAHSSRLTNYTYVSLRTTIAAVDRIDLHMVL